MIAEKIATAAQWTGTGGAMVFGLTPSEWSVIGVIGSLLLGLLGYLTTAWFNHQRNQILRARAMPASEQGE